MSHGDESISAAISRRHARSSPRFFHQASGGMRTSTSAADSLLMNASTVAARLAKEKLSNRRRLARNAATAMSIQNSAMPSNRAAIHATASAAGGNTANITPAASATASARRPASTLIRHP